MSAAPDLPPVLTVVVISFEMSRELPRTLLSLSPGYQQGMEGQPYEVIVVDNGSATPPVAADFAGLGLDLRVLHCMTGTRSPVDALNMGLAASRGELICCMIDGARMASPGLLSASIAASRLHPRPIVFSASMMLGHHPQWRAHETGYSAAVEDALLDSIRWPEDGYRLFEVSNGQSSAPSELRWYAPGHESNAITLPRALWAEVGGYDPGFQTAGGGFSSCDLFARSAHLPGVQVIVLGGEATFHQFHGKSASTAHRDGLDQMRVFSQEYFRLRNCAFKPVRKPFWFFQMRNPVLERTTKSTKGAAIPQEQRYLDLLEQRLLNSGAREVEAHLRALVAVLRAEGRVDLLKQAQAGRAYQLRRVMGAEQQGLLLDPTLLPSALTMTGRRRLQYLRRCVETVLDQAIPGDLVECGVWRGGSAMMMAAVLAARGDQERKVWLADSFEGLPRQDGNYDTTAQADLLNANGLAVTEATVRDSFTELGLMGDSIRFLPGWFCDTLPSAPIERIALLRLDGDLYSSTMDALTALYHKVVPGGFIIIDDYALQPCADAVNAFREMRGIHEPMERIDQIAMAWRKHV